MRVSYVIKEVRGRVSEEEAAVAEAKGQSARRGAGGALCARRGRAAHRRALAYELERSLAAAEKMRKLGGLTVERLRALAGEGVDAALSPRRALRRHALVVVGNGGMPAATTGCASGRGWPRGSTAPPSPTGCGSA